MSDQADPAHPIRLLLTGGGTGGHLFPAVATAEKLRNRSPDSAILFVGTNRRLDRKHLQRSGFPVQTIHCYGLKGKRLLELCKALAVLPISFGEACWRIIRFRPDVVCGVGGYVTGPVVAAAWLLRRPTIIHEQNSVPGLANRLLGRLVDRVCISLPASAHHFPPGKTTLTGNPVRQAILEAAARPAKPADGPKNLLVLGGSQGARAINELVTTALTDLPDLGFRLQVVHQTGSADEQLVRQRYQRAGIEAVVAPFFDDMATIYARADLVVSRAGATTLAELAVLGLPALLIPYPFAADDHQRGNARWYVESGGALLFDQQELTAERLAAELLGLISDEKRLQQMGAAMGRRGIDDAAERIVDICLLSAGQ